MKLLLLNTKPRLIVESNVSKDVVNLAVVTSRELFMEARQKNAASVILLHNHPSGVPSPSRKGAPLAKRAKEAGPLIWIELLDHIILGDNSYVSMWEKEFLI